jgi:hypothetical protein
MAAPQSHRAFLCDILSTSSEINTSHATLAQGVSWSVTILGQRRIVSLGFDFFPTGTD